MAWKPKKKVGKTLYMVNLSRIFPNKRDGEYNFNYNTWSNRGLYYVPSITKFKDVQAIMNGATKSTLFIIAKKDKDEERKVYKLNGRIKLVKENDNTIYFQGGGYILTNNKTEIFLLLSDLYRRKKQAALEKLKIFQKNSLDGKDMWGNRIPERNTKYFAEIYNNQTRAVDKNYKEFVKQLKKI